MSGAAQSVGNLMSSQLARQLVAPLPPNPRPYVRMPRLYHALNTNNASRQPLATGHTRTHPHGRRARIDGPAPRIAHHRLRFQFEPIFGLIRFCACYTSRTLLSHRPISIRIRVYTILGYCFSFVSLSR